MKHAYQLDRARVKCRSCGSQLRVVVLGPESDPDDYVVVCDDCERATYAPRSWWPAIADAIEAAKEWMNRRAVRRALHLS